MGNVVDIDPRKRRKWKARRSAPPQPQTPYIRKRPVDGQFPDWVPGVALATGIAILATALFTSPMASGIGCDIKGNISVGGERIYHVPGQEYYSQSIINFLNRERWFCSEEDARAAGWRRAYR